MTWFEIGFKVGLGFVVAGLFVGIAFITLAALYSAFTKRFQRKKDRQTQCVLAKWEGTD